MTDQTADTGRADEAKVLFITGASMGIGAAVARHAVGAGYRVVLTARSLDKLEALAAELGPEKALALKVDVTEWKELEGSEISTTQGDLGLTQLEQKNI